jgi:hypothetical protein
VIPRVLWNIKTKFNVKANHFAMVINEHKQGKRTLLYGPGYHILGYYNTLVGIYTFGEDYSRRGKDRQVI